MAIFRIVDRPDGSKTMVRHKLETASEHPLTDLEEIVNELLDEREQGKGIDLREACDYWMPDKGTSATRCKNCGKDRWQHPL